MTALATQAIRRPSAQLFPAALAFVSAFRKCAISTFQKQQHACLPHGSQFPASAICKQHGHLTRSTNVTACSACVACDALDSSQCMPKINHPSSQAATRPIFVNNAFCECIVHCHLSRAPTCMTHKLGFPPACLQWTTLALKPALTSQAPASDAWDAAVAPLPIFALFQQGRMPFARHRHEAHMRANLIPAACFAEACAAI